jgi:hypothetical protein
MSLAALDGSEGEQNADGGGLPASFGPPALPPSQHQMFAPPPEEAAVELAIDIDEDRARRKTPVSSPTVPPPAPPPKATLPPPPKLQDTSYAGSGSDLAAAVPGGRSSSSGIVDRAKQWLADDRKRFATGIGLVIALGFIPAHVVASIREDAAFSAIDARLVERQASVQSIEQWEQLDKLRTSMLDRKHGERRDIALTAIAIWAAVAGGLGYLWFRRIDWDRVTR